MSVLERLVQKLLWRISPGPESPQDLTEEIREALRNEILSPIAYSLFERILKIQDKTLGEILVPRVDMVVVKATWPLQRVVEVYLEHGYSKMPVIEKRVDQVVGVVHIKEVLRYLDQLDSKTARDIALPPRFFPETKTVLETLEEFKRLRVSLGLVVDEHGTVVGLVTLEDLLEEIVGEIWEEYDREEKLYERRSDGSLLLNTKLEIQKAAELLGIEVPENGNRISTLGGLLMASLDHVPAPGETIEIQGIQFTVVEATPQRVQWVLARPKPEKETTASR